MTLGVFDHLAAIVLVAALPLFGVWEYRRFQASVAAGLPDARMKAYRFTMGVEWGLVLAVIVLWLATPRALSALGLGFEAGRGAWIGIALALAACVLLVAQTVTTLRKEESMEAARKQIAPLRDLLPHDAREGRVFALLSITAGVCEELLYRGYLIAYFAANFDMWVAVVVSSLVFGLGHIYQGAGGVVKTGVIGLIMAGLYLLTGSLWAPMLLHAVVDLNSGYLARRVIELSPQSRDQRENVFEYQDDQHQE